MSAVLQLLFAEAGAAASGRQALLDRLTEVVVIQLLRHLGNEGFVEHGALAALADPALGKALEAVHAQPAHPWTLEEVAAVAGMSRARFALRFRDVAGQTFGDYLADWRIGVAKSLLRKGLPVKTVAQEVGYANASALARVFVNKDQPTPRSWIRKARAEALAPVD